MPIFKLQILFVKIVNGLNEKNTVRAAHPAKIAKVSNGVFRFFKNPVPLFR